MEQGNGKIGKGGVFCWRDLRVDFGLHQVWRGGKPVPLTPREFALLEALLRHRNLTLARDQLLQQAWGYDYAGESRTVDVHINRLRRKLGMGQVIQTVYRIGYRLVLPPDK
ncbi:MAG: winged helix-turn-helix domain-containing protein [Gemmiger sp.]|uniref:winged helix-turn-helix domain-containing protein n=1 Tax=Gemmiger sp. TaxID=2049027 RepID=UPI002A910CAB|nr:winged helix-turn-helix domain-containing protein [Gemmiger sp.]MDY5325918.1 winged helix-turn-helix domain-containing protein [Gemmiger sp.]